MAYQVTPLTAVNFLIFLFAAVLAGYGARRYLRRGHRSELLAFVSLMFAISLWELSIVVSDVVTTQGPKLLATSLANALGLVVLYSLLWFALTYTDNDRWVNRWTAGLAAGHIAVNGFVFLLAPEIMYEPMGLETKGPVTVLNVTVQQWVDLDATPQLPFYLLAPYSYLLQVGSAAIIGWYVLRNRSALATGQAVALGVGIVTPAVVNSLAIARVFPQWLNLNDVALGVTAAAFAVAVFRYRLLRLAPVGRQQVVETMADPVVMLDADERVVDTNPAARDLVDAGAGWRGMAAEQFFAPLAEQVGRFWEATSLDREISVEMDGGTRHFDLEVSPIRRSQQNGGGRVIVFREVTRLKEREQELDLMRQIQSRVLRHNVRNDLSVVKGYSEALGEGADEERAEMAETIGSTADRLLSVSTKARAAENLIDQDQTPSRLDLAAMVEAVVETYREAYPRVSFTLDCPEERSVETVPAMEFAIENLVENAAEHNDAADPTVEVVVDDQADATVVTVSDNGPGIPDHELAVLQAGEETPLEHGSGIGLWVVQWVIEESRASIDYGTGPEGTTVTLRIPGGDTGN